MNNNLLNDLGHSGAGYQRQSIPPNPKVTGSVQAGTSSSSMPSSDIVSIPFIRPSSPTASRCTSDSKRPLTFLNTDDFFIMKSSSECKYCVLLKLFSTSKTNFHFYITLLLTVDNNLTTFQYSIFTATISIEDSFLQECL